MNLWRIFFFFLLPVNKKNKLFINFGFSVWLHVENFFPNRTFFIFLITLQLEIRKGASFNVKYAFNFLSRMRLQF